MNLHTSPRPYTLEVGGPLACFTRPEMKVERVSYEVITPSAARAIFEAIYWKPQVRWQVVQIEVLNPIAFTHIRRSEVASLAHVRKPHIVAEENRQLRSSLVLRDVRYRLTAELRIKEGGGDGDGELAKHASIFERRARRGQCFTQPYLGCREFAAHWQPVETTHEPARGMAESRDLGMMLYDMDFANAEKPQPQFYRAVMYNGIINVPQL